MIKTRYETDKWRYQKMDILNMDTDEDCDRYEIMW
jgi:hypothetical protein